MEHMSPLLGKSLRLVAADGGVSLHLLKYTTLTVTPCVHENSGSECMCMGENERDRTGH